MSKCLLIRVDASPEIGTGHVMRCLALAQAWCEIGGGSVAVATATMPASITARMDRESIVVHTLSAGDAAEINRIADSIDATHVVLDGYGFGDDLEKELAIGHRRVMAIDDFGHARHQHADLVLNQNIYARPSDYSHVGSQTRLLLGTTYALLRREFWSWRDREPRRRETARNVLVTTGGSDASGFSERAVEAFRDLPVSARLIVGPSNPRRQSLERLAAAVGVEAVIDPLDISQQMEWADVAISAAGSTCWELLFMGVPTLAVALADNQRAVEAGLVKACAAQSLGWHAGVTPLAVRRALERLLSDEPARHALGRQGRIKVDGYGALRVVRALMDTV